MLPAFRPMARIQGNKRRLMDLAAGCIAVLIVLMLIFGKGSFNALSLVSDFGIELGFSQTASMGRPNLETLHAALVVNRSVFAQACTSRLLRPLQQSLAWAFWLDAALD